jgi:hypothetical protein
MIWITHFPAELVFEQPANSIYNLGVLFLLQTACFPEDDGFIGGKNLAATDKTIDRKTSL